MRGTVPFYINTRPNLKTTLKFMVRIFNGESHMRDFHFPTNEGSGWWRGGGTARLVNLAHIALHCRGGSWSVFVLWLPNRPAESPSSLSYKIEVCSPTGLYRCAQLGVKCLYLNSVGRRIGNIVVTKQPRGGWTEKSYWTRAGKHVMRSERSGALSSSVFYGTFWMTDLWFYRVKYFNNTHDEIS